MKANSPSIYDYAALGLVTRMMHETPHARQFISAQWGLSLDDIDELAHRYARTGLQGLGAKLQNRGL